MGEIQCCDMDPKMRQAYITVINLSLAFSPLDRKTQYFLHLNVVFH